MPRYSPNVLSLTRSLCTKGVIKHGYANFFLIRPGEYESLSRTRDFGHALWAKDWVRVSSELAQDRRAWGASIRDVVSSVGGAGSTRPGRMPTQGQFEAVPGMTHDGGLSVSV